MQETADRPRIPSRVKGDGAMQYVSAVQTSSRGSSCAHNRSQRCSNHVPVWKMETTPNIVEHPPIMMVPLPTILGLTWSMWTVIMKKSSQLIAQQNELSCLEVVQRLESPDSLKPSPSPISRKPSRWLQIHLLWWLWALSRSDKRPLSHIGGHIQKASWVLGSGYGYPSVQMPNCITLLIQTCSVYMTDSMLRVSAFPLKETDELVHGVLPLHTVKPLLGT